MKRFIGLFELQDASQARWLSMEGLRGFAVGLVFFVHYSSFMQHQIFGSGIEYWWLDAIHEIGNAGVDLFFVLSGFLIYRACIYRPIVIRKYAWRRVERIYPTFLAVLGIYVLVMVVVPSTSKLPESAMDTGIYILQNLFLLPGMLRIEPIITVAWSLSYEAFYYIVTPALIILLSMQQWRPRGRIALFVLIYVLMSVAELSGMFAHFRLSMFIGGIILYEISTGATEESGKKPSIVIDLASVFLLFVSLCSFAAFGGSRWMIEGLFLDSFPAMSKFVLLTAALVFLVYRCLFVKGVAASLFSWSPMRWLGNMSYSYYLFHGFALNLFFVAIDRFGLVSATDPILYIYLLIPAFLVSVVMTMPLYLLVERPISLK